MFRKTYRITNWRRWDAELEAAVFDFQAKTGGYPNVLLANPVTLNRINIAAMKAPIGENIDKPHEAKPSQEYTDLTCFAGKDYILMFAEYPKLQDTFFSLLDDPDPKGGEPWPDEDTVGVTMQGARKKATR